MGLACIFWLPLDHVDIHPAKEAEAVNHNFWGAGGEVCRVNGSVLDLDVVAAEESDTAHADTETFRNPDIDASANADRLNSRDMLLECCTA